MSERRPLPWRTVVAVGVMIAAVGGALRFRGDASVWLTTGAAALVGLGLALWAGRGPLRDRVGITARTSGIGLAAGVAMVVATWTLYPIAAGWIAGLEGAVRSLYASLEAPPGLLAATPILILVITAEELVYRDVLVTALQERFAPLATGALAVALYAAPQLIGGSWLLLGVAFGCGIVWTALRLWTGGVWAPWVCHVVWDLAVFVAFPLERPAEG